jgi:hypothetical protein
MTTRRCAGERGASLVIALGFLALCGVLIPAIVNLAGTNLSGTSRLHTQRSDLYAADGAVDGALQYLRQHQGCGTLYADCPSPVTDPSCAAGTGFSAAVNGGIACVVVKPKGGAFDADRTVELIASVGGKQRVDATAIIRDSLLSNTVPLGSQPVDVKSWTYNR